MVKEVTEATATQLAPRSGAERQMASVEREYELADPADLSSIIRVRGHAEALRCAVKTAGLGLNEQNRMAEIKIRAERTAGETIPLVALHGGDRKSKSRLHDVTLIDLGVSKRDSHNWQAIADIPDDTFEEYVNETKEQREELTSAGALRLAHKLRRKKRRIQAAKDVTGDYRVIYADPPWSYGNSGLDEYGHAERHYDTLSIDELCELVVDEGKDRQVKDIAEDNAVLFLWTTSPLLEDAFRVIRAWGFQYKSSFVWDKVKHNFGYYNSVRHEFLLIGTRGSCTPDNPKLHDSVVTIERPARHSEKPGKFRAIIDELYTPREPEPDRIDLFARSRVPNWNAWGDQVD